MSNSLAPECNDAKDTQWLTPRPEYLKGTEKNNDECAALFKDYQKCLVVALKEKGIDKLIEEAREDNKDNDARLVPDE
ncbi:hypothetical protein E4U19_001831 [Claviceps sp. Clav32 group G5]|nr:hypothetical protein E4U19_001831 [Claviceps sp. Clav32 group G5]